MVTLRPGNRLSITPVTEAEWKHISESCSEERHAAAGAGAPADRLHADLADAPGRPLPARVQRDARQRGQLPRARQVPRARHRGRRCSRSSAFRSTRRSSSPTSSPCPTRWASASYFAEGEGPRFERPLRDEAAIARLAVPDPATELRYVFDAVREIRARAGRPRAADRLLRQPLHARLLHGRGLGQRRLAHVKTMRHARPDLLHRILEVNARAVTDYLNAQIEAGAQVVMIFDTWGGSLAHDDYETFSLAYMRKVLAAQRRGVPSILFTKGGNPWLARDRCERLRRGRPRLDERSARGAAARRRAASRCKAISIPPCCLRRPKRARSGAARARCASARRRATSSISATASRRRRRPDCGCSAGRRSAHLQQETAEPAAALDLCTKRARRGRYPGIRRASVAMRCSQAV